MQISVLLLTFRILNTVPIETNIFLLFTIIFTYFKKDLGVYITRYMWTVYDDALFVGKNVLI